MRAGLAVSLLALCLAAATAGSGRAAAPPRVTVIGDSVATGIQFNEPARRILADGVTLQLELAVCRRIADTSCPYEGVRPPTLVDVVALAGASLGETVIVAVGYNDFEDQYAAELQTALAALRAAGVKRILWATLRAARNPYLTMNDAIREAAERNPDVTLVDWNLYSRSHPDWFQDDGIHLTGAGAEAMARLFHDTLVGLGVPIPPLVVATARLPGARVGKAFSTRLRARGGAPPYRWALRGARPRGLSVSPSGRLTWQPSVSGRFSLTVLAVDANGTSANHRLRLSVRR